MTKLLTYERLREVLHYDSETGVFVWKIKPSRKIKLGSIAGARHIEGYVQIQIDGINYLAHRLAWIYSFNLLDSKLDIDHINGIRDDNRIANLRLATRTENLYNAKLSSRNESGNKGVSWCKRTCKWQVTVSVNGTLKHLGRYANKYDAIAVRDEYAKRLHGEFYRAK